jgi:hypothetical protein
MPVTHEVASSSLVGPATADASAFDDGGEMGSTVLARLKLQVEMSTSLNGSKKKKRKRVTSSSIINAAVLIFLSCGEMRASLSRIGPEGFSFCLFGMKT